MTYEEFKDYIKHTQIPKEDYYIYLLEFYDEILLDIFNRNQGVVARDLKINPTKLSNIMPIIKAFKARQILVPLQSHLDEQLTTTATNDNKGN